MTQPTAIGRGNWRLRSVPQRPRRALPRRGLVDRRHPRARWSPTGSAAWATSGSACARRCGRGPARSPTSTGRPARSPPRCAPGASDRATSSSSSSPTGSRPASRSGPPPTSARSWCRSCTSTAPRRSSTSSAPPSPTWSSPPTASATPTTWPRGTTCSRATPCPLWLVVGRHADAATCPAAATPFADLLDADPLAGPAPVDPDAPAIIGFTSGTTTRPQGRRSTRTARSAARRASSTTCSRRAARRRSPARRWATSSACSTPSSCRCSATAPVNLIDVWDPGEVLRLMLRRGPRRRRRGHLLPHQPARPPRLHRRAPGADALRRPRRLDGAVAVTERATRLGIKAFRSYGSTEHPSITGCLIDDARGQAAHDRRPRRCPASRCGSTTTARSRAGAPTASSATPTPSSPPRCSTPTAGTAPATSACSTTRATSRSPTGCPTSSSAAARTSAPRRSRSCCSASTASPRSAWSPPPTSGSASTPPPSSACATGAVAPSLDDVRAHLAAAGLARQKWPESLHVVDDLPRTPSGKVQKFRLRQQLRDGRL